MAEAEKNGNGEPPTSEKQPEKPANMDTNGAMETPIFVTIPADELDQIKKEAEEFKDKYLRVLAESENMRKRMQKERQELIQYAMQNVIVEFLMPIDHMETALKYTQNMSDEVKNWAFGFQMILSQFKEVLSGHGVVAFDSIGTPFDPHQHEAVEMVPTAEHPPGIVFSESVRGYKMNNKVIRPARVTVAKAVEEPKVSDVKTPEEKNKV